MYILAIESSCDETAIAILEGKRIIVEKVASQIKAHRKYGGVMPECASRLHTEVMMPLIQEAVSDANLTLNALDCIAVTQGPGLEGSLLVGVSTAKTLATFLKIPLLGVNHMQAHIYAAFSQQEPKFPLCALVVSGGHSLLVKMNGHTQFEILGQTRDDACGEAFDKVARLLGLPYPGGPEIEKIATEGEVSITFPRPMLKDGLDFSFSGLKTAVSQWLIAAKNNGSTVEIADVAASFQVAVADVLSTKTQRALECFDAKQLVLCGGVMSNQYIASIFKETFQYIETIQTPKKWCTDNAVMIGLAAYYQYKHLYQKPVSLNPSLSICN